MRKIRKTIRRKRNETKRGKRNETKRRKRNETKRGERNGIKKRKRSINKKKISEFTIPENKRFIKNLINTTILKKGTLLYRTQPVKCDKLKKMKCSDTGKVGVYFGKNKYTPIGMILEYKKPMYFCTYELKKDVKLYNGKYIFRYLEPDNYFKSMDDLKNEDFILHISPKKSTNHIHGGVKGAEDYLMPIDDIFEPFWTDEGWKLWGKLDEAEIFLTDPRLVKCIDRKFMEISEAKDEIERLIHKIFPSSNLFTRFKKSIRKKVEHH